MPIYGIIVKKTNGKGFNVISTDKKKLDAYAAKEKKKGFLVIPFYKSYTMLKIEGETGIFHRVNG